MSIIEELEDEKNRARLARIDAYKALSFCAADHDRNAVVDALQMLAIEYGNSSVVPKSGGEKL